MKIQALPEAVEVWKQPDSMFRDWETSASKLEMEQEVSNLVGKVKDVADLGCGPGRYANILSCLTYHGFDAHDSMLQYNMKLPNHPKFMQARFFNKDVFATGRKHVYEVVLLIDVLQHQEDPIAALQQVFSLWQAQRYIFTALVGREYERLLNSIVVTQAQLNVVLAGRQVVYTKDFSLGEERFMSVLFEVRG